jgi:hypothetical protein
VQTFASSLHERNARSSYVTREAHEKYLLNNPNNESRSFWPIAEGPWQDAETGELVAADAREVTLRGAAVRIPQNAQFRDQGIELEEAPSIQTFELCRLLAGTHRNDVLATPAERRCSVPPELEEILVLDEWHHPDLVSDELASDSETFRQLAKVLESGNVSEYRPSQPPNTHWRNWPEGGTL